MSIAFAIIGISCIRFGRQWVSWSWDIQRRVFHFTYGEWLKKFSEFWYVVMGIFMLLFSFVILVAGLTK